MSLVDEWSSDIDLACVPVTLLLSMKYQLSFMLELHLFSSYNHILATDSRVQQKSVKVFYETQLTVRNLKERIVYSVVCKLYAIHPLYQ